MDNQNTIIKFGGRTGVVVWTYSNGDVRVLWHDDGTESDCDADYCEVL